MRYEETLLDIKEQYYEEQYYMYRNNIKYKGTILDIKEQY